MLNITEQEKKILELKADNKTDKEIAEALNLDEAYVHDVILDCVDKIKKYYIKNGPTLDQMRLLLVEAHTELIRIDNILKDPNESEDTKDEYKFRRVLQFQKINTLILGLSAAIKAYYDGMESKEQDKENIQKTLFKNYDTNIKEGKS